MSDPASNVGIEDVLASVRRLVSAERQAHEAVLAPGDQPAGEGADNVDALVLTADLRIVQSDAKTQKNGAAVADAGRDAAASADLDGISAKPSGVVPTPAATLTRGKADRDAAPADAPEKPRVLSLEDRIAQLEAAVQAHANAEFEPDGSEDLAQHRPDHIPGMSSEDDWAEAIGSDLAAQFGRDEDSAEPAKDDAASVKPGAAEAADLVKAALNDSFRGDVLAAIVSRSISDDDDGEATHFDWIGAESEKTADSAAEVSEPPKAAPGKDAVATAEQTGVEDASNKRGLIDEKADQSVVRTHNVARPIVSKAAENDGPAKGMEPEAQSKARSAPARAGKADADDGLHQRDDAEGSGGLDLGEESRGLDEETLRDLVAEIVREELQGALGERITRNVRKLVRREIMRTLSVRDFD